MGKFTPRKKIEKRRAARFDINNTERLDADNQSQQPITPINKIAPLLPETRRTSVRRTRQLLQNLRVRSESPVIGDRSKSFYEIANRGIQKQMACGSLIDLRENEQMNCDSSMDIREQMNFGSLNEVENEQMNCDSSIDIIETEQVASCSSTDFGTSKQMNQCTQKTPQIRQNQQMNATSGQAKIILANDDGNCFAHSAIISMRGESKNEEHQILRLQIAETIKQLNRTMNAEQKDYFINLIMSNLPPDKTMENYGFSISQYADEVTAVDKTFLGMAEAQAMAVLLQRPVIIVSPKRGRGIRKGTKLAIVYLPDHQRREHTIKEFNYDALWELEQNPVVLWHNGNNHYNGIYKQIPNMHPPQQMALSSSNNYSTEQINSNSTLEQMTCGSLNNSEKTPQTSSHRENNDEIVQTNDQLIVETFPVEFDQAELEPPTEDGKKRRGRPSKKRGGCRPSSGRKSIKSSGASARPIQTQISLPVDDTDLSNDIESTSTIVQQQISPLAHQTSSTKIPRLLYPYGTPLSKATNKRLSNRQKENEIKLYKKQREQINAHMKKVHKEYHDRPWPLKPSQKKDWIRCSPNCDCTSFSECQQNAAAYNAVDKYLNANNNLFEAQRKKGVEEFYEEATPQQLNGPTTARCHSFANKNNTIGCAAISANHRVHYYDSGQFGDAVCDHCPAKLLNSEKEQFKTKKTFCCSNGDVHTEEMKKRYNELQNPPDEYKELVKDEEFLNNTMPLNNTFAFASVHAERAPDEQLGSRMDTCKYNGEFSFMFYDLKAPEKDGKTQQPAFAQVYTLLPEDAAELREKNFQKALGKPISKKIIKTLEKIMRESPFGKTFQTTGEMIRESTNEHGEIPRFQIVLMTTREVKEDVIKNKGNCKLIERTDVPTAEQVAVIWVDQDGLAPEVSGFKIRDRAGQERELKNGMPQLDGCCFPILHPRSTPGWQWLIRKKKYENVKQQMARSTTTTELNEQMAQCSTTTELNEQMAQCSTTTELNEQIAQSTTTELNEQIAQSTTTELNEQIAQSITTELNEQMVLDLQNTQQMNDDLPDVPNLSDANFYELIGEQMNDNEAEETSQELDNDQDTDNNQKPTNYGEKFATNKSGPEMNISERQYYRYLMAIWSNGKNEFHWLWFARRLAEFFTISILNRIERNEMDQLKKQQEKRDLRSILARDYIAAIEKGLQRKFGGKLGKVFMMNKHFPGSTQYYQAKFADLMTIVREYGNPTWFITFTGNPEWPELKSALQENQEWVHRADIVCRIFMSKADKFLEEVTQKHVMGKMAAWCYSVEHQKRGMPHLHLLLIQDKDERIATPDEVNDYICARIPPLPRMDDISPEANQQRRLWHHVTNCMLHHCNQSCASPKGCNKHFPKSYSKQTILSAERYAQYVRLDSDGAILGNDSSEQMNSGFNDSTEQMARGFENIDEDSIGPHNDPDHDAQVQYQRNQPEQMNRLSDSNEEISKDWNKEGLTYYKRTRGNVSVLDDRNVTSYNPYLLLRFGCHINVEYVFGQKACHYIFKYILKGYEKAYVKVIQPGNQDVDVYNYDEPAAMFKVRYMTSMEGFLRLYSYKIVNMSHQIYTMGVHDENGQTIILEEGQEETNERKIHNDTRLTGFFKLCATNDHAKQFTYDEIPLHYWWDNIAKIWKRRVKNKKMNFLVRIYSVSPNKPELLAIRILLMNVKGPTSFRDLRTVDGITYETFTQAAQKLGLLADDQLFKDALNDASLELTGKRLQRYFANLLFHGKPADPKQLFEEFLDKLFPPPAINAAENEQNQQGLSDQYRRNDVLRNLEYFFRCLGSNCRDAGIGDVPPDYNHEEQEATIEGEELVADFYGKESRRTPPSEVALKQLNRLNEDQKKAFFKIKEALDNPDSQRCFFVEGSGGTGKSFLYNSLMKWMLAGKPNPEQMNLSLDSNDKTTEQMAKSLSKNVEQFQQMKLRADEQLSMDKLPTLKRNSVISAASTGIAATLLIGAATVHRQFYVPNDVNNKTMPRINHEKAEAQRLRTTELIIIDEVSMLDEKVLNYVDRLLREVCQSQQPFGGKVIILGGDWKQLTPVVPGGGKTEQIGASIKMDNLFVENFETLRLTINMRAAPDQIKLREWLAEIGTRNTDCLNIPKENQTTDLQEIIDFCFPADLFDNPLGHAEKICEAALLCPRNEDVHKINESCITRMRGKIETCISIDEPLEQLNGNTSPNGFQINQLANTVEAINKETPTGLPPHILKLKIGAPVMLIRNLDISQGLCNGTRLQVTRIGKQNIKCRILTGPKKNTEVLIPMVKIDYGTEQNHRGLRFRRIQYPLRLCFAMTVNKSQGQTLERMGLVLNGHQCFSHGQVYVAMSRVTSLAGIRVFSKTNDQEEMAIQNIVYEELLDSEPVNHESEKKIQNYQIDSESEWSSVYSDYFD